MKTREVARGVDANRSKWINVSIHYIQPQFKSCQWGIKHHIFQSCSGWLNEQKMLRLLHWFKSESCWTYTNALSNFSMVWVWQNFHRINSTASSPNYILASPLARKASSNPSEMHKLTRADQIRFGLLLSANSQVCWYPVRGKETRPAHRISNVNDLLLNRPAWIMSISIG